MIQEILIFCFIVRKLRKFFIFIEFYHEIWFINIIVDIILDLFCWIIITWIIITWIISWIIIIYWIIINCSIIFICFFKFTSFQMTTFTWTWIKNFFTILTAIYFLIINYFSWFIVSTLFKVLSIPILFPFGKI